MFFAFAAVGLLAVAISLYIRRDRRLSKINGPKGNPFVGIGLALPPNATQKLREWAVEYGEVYKMRIGWYNWVVLNSPDAIKEVFDRQVCSSYTSRLIHQITISSLFHARQRCQHQLGSLW